jgi:hypothetical protein
VSLCGPRRGFGQAKGSEGGDEGEDGDRGEVLGAVINAQLRGAGPLMSDLGTEAEPGVR